MKSAWLMRGEDGRSHSLPKTAATLSRQAYWIPSDLKKDDFQKTGGNQ
jgi:hypothetical protein